MFLGTGTMVVCLKHVCITDSDRERLKMSVKTLASWSAHARSTHSGNPCGLVNVVKEKEEEIKTFQDAQGFVLSLTSSQV